METTPNDESQADSELPTRPVVPATGGLSTVGNVIAEGSPDKWRALGRAVLGFHYRVALTAMCRCGRTVIECDVLHHARGLGLIPPL